MQNLSLSTNYKHLTLEERVEIYRLFNQGISLRDIALKVKRNVSTISRELKRNRSRHTKKYKPIKAQEISFKKAIKQRTKAPLKCPLVFLYVREKLRLGWSPEIVSGRLTLDYPDSHICAETIYLYIYGKGKRFKLWQYLKQVRPKRKRKFGRGIKKDKSQSKIPQAVSIDFRSNKANSRKQAGHFETDLIEGKRSEKAALSLTVCRKTRYSLLNKVPNKSSESKQKTLTFSLKNLKSLEMSTYPIVRSVTADNGTENTKHQEISKELKTKFFFCHPYHSWEKGTVENTIGRIRRYLPKGSSIHNLTTGQIQWLENNLNNTPRKCLKYKTPNEAMEQEVNKYKFRRYRKLKETSVALQLGM